MDILLGRFADRWIDTLSIGDLTALDALLGESDPDLYNWITGQEDPPAAHRGPLMERLRQSAAAG